MAPLATHMGQIGGQLVAVCWRLAEGQTTDTSCLWMGFTNL